MVAKKSLKKSAKTVSRKVSRVDGKILRDPLYKMDKTTIIHKEHTYRGIATASIAVLYCLILLVVYTYFNYDVMFFPKS